MKTLSEITERLDKIKNQKIALDNEFKNGNMLASNYTQGMDLLEEKEAMLEWVLKD